MCTGIGADASDLKGPGQEVAATTRKAKPVVDLHAARVEHEDDVVDRDRRFCDAGRE